MGTLTGTWTKMHDVTGVTSPTDIMIFLVHVLVYLLGNVLLLPSGSEIAARRRRRRFRNGWERSCSVFPFVWMVRRVVQERSETLGHLLALNFTSSAFSDLRTKTFPLYFWGFIWLIQNGNKNPFTVTSFPIRWSCMPNLGCQESSWAKLFTWLQPCRNSRFSPLLEIGCAAVWERSYSKPSKSGPCIHVTPMFTILD